ncbi:HPF/RaiA family ribosome-associated protein [Pseudaminobacter sp. NGMCC 1.201702]|uniref:HPF/RaiA family ribosome-associated protein n=1 Tax=Pseudaminobacter sp. NGMCC 1.201702 TaxID=3391825 RepID=UPI0039EF5942
MTLPHWLQTIILSLTFPLHVRGTKMTCASADALMRINAPGETLVNDRIHILQERSRMESEPQINFRGMEPSPSVEEVVRERIARLGRFHDRITFCAVVIEAPHRHGRQGKLYRVLVDIAVPGAAIVTGMSRRNHDHEDVYVAIRDSFDAAQRKLEDFVRKNSGYRVKTHPETLHGTLARLMLGEGYGFILAQDGHEFFFRRENMTSQKEWSVLSEGREVRFSEHDGARGPYASAVTVA